MKTFFISCLLLLSLCGFTQTINVSGSGATYTLNNSGSFQYTPIQVKDAGTDAYFDAPFSPPPPITQNQLFRSGGVWKFGRIFFCSGCYTPTITISSTLASNTTKPPCTGWSGFTLSGDCITTSVSSITVYDVVGGGVACGAGGNSGTGGPGVAICLSGSQVGVSYQLRRGTINVGPIREGTGVTLYFPSQTIAGTYKIIATVAGTSLSATMSGAATVTTGTLPSVFNVKGGGTACGAGSAIGLSLSQVNIHYQLKQGSSDVGTVLSGTGAALNFGPQPAIGTYTVLATNPLTGCNRTMNSSAIITACAARQGIAETDLPDLAESENWAMVAPNPILKNKISLRISKQAGQMIQWNLITMQGIILAGGSFKAATNSHHESIEIQSVMTGMYLIGVEANQKKAVIKVWKTE